jgi:hypothetical protein
MHLRLLRLFLFVSGLTWAISIVGVFVSWGKANEFLQGLGARPITYDPMVEYWLRMAAGAFFLIGVLFFVLTIFPHRFVNMIPIMGWLMLTEGMFLAIHGFRLGLPPFPFYGDISACFVLGSGILYFASSSRVDTRTTAHVP